MMMMMMMTTTTTMMMMVEFVEVMDFIRNSSEVDPVTSYKYVFRR